MIYYSPGSVLGVEVEEAGAEQAVPLEVALQLALVAQPLDALPRHLALLLPLAAVPVALSLPRDGAAELGALAPVSLAAPVADGDASALGAAVGRPRVVAPTPRDLDPAAARSGCGTKWRFDLKTELRWDWCD